MIERIDNKLDGWKSKLLTLEGRQVLAQSALCTIPYFTMQSTIFPVGVCDYIDRKVRSFIWGSKDNERKCHLVK